MLFGYPLIGMIIEAYGFIVLFSGFFPVAVNFLRRIPIIGSILNLPGISSVIFSDNYFQTDFKKFLDFFEILDETVIQTSFSFFSFRQFFTSQELM